MTLSLVLLLANAPLALTQVVDRYPGIHMIDAAGAVVDYCLHTARDRS